MVLPFTATNLQSTFTFNDGKLVEEQKKVKPEDKDSHFEVCKYILINYRYSLNSILIFVLQRYIDSNGQLVIECESEGVKAVRKYEKVPA
jgi:hypothetical protein